MEFDHVHVRIKELVEGPNRANVNSTCMEHAIEQERRRQLKKLKGAR